MPTSVAATPILIFGAGMTGERLLNSIEEAGIPVIGFLDNFRSVDRLFCGKPVFRVNHPPIDVDMSNMIVLIAVESIRHSISEIQTQLSTAGWKNVYTLGEFVRQFRDVVGDMFWRTEPGHYDRPEIIEAIKRARELWADDKSRLVFDGLLEFRRTFNESALTPGEPDEYFPSDIPPWSNPVRYVDGGAFDGDSLAELLRRGFTVEAAAMFEPDLDNFKRLAGRWQYSEVDFPLLCWPCALTNRDGTVSFKTGLGTDCKLTDEDDGTQLQCLRMDSALRGYRPSLIKLDIEGAELLALDGALETLRSARPGWVVCVYHRANDLWEIPLWFARHAHGLGYSFYLRNHGRGISDHCLYAIPN